MTTDGTGRDEDSPCGAPPLLVPHTKEAWRHAIRQRYLRTTAAARQQWSQEICASLLTDSHIRAAHYILAYYPLPDEADITPLFAPLQAAGKTLLLPEVVAADDMILREYSDAEHLTRGVLHTLNATGEIFSDYARIDVALVPGVAFTAEGARLGRGKGYYDRFLPRLANAYLYGICFPYQVVESLPCSAHDVRVHCVPPPRIELGSKV